jgi:Fe-S cluster biogenesis protein NfuA
MGETAREMNTLEEQIESALDQYVRPLLATHGGDLEVLRVEDGLVYFRMLGHCAGCAAADLTSEDLINKELVEHVPGVRRAVLENRVSQELMDQAREILNRRRMGS